MDRRKALKLTAILTGAISTPFASSFLIGCNPSNTEGLSTFTKKEFSILQELLTTLLPEGDIPGAISLGIDTTIDHMVASTYTEKDQSRYKKQFTSLRNHLEKQSFGNAADTERLTILTSLEERLKNGEHDDAVSAYLHVKQQAIAYFLSSETINTEFLNYLPVPGEFIGCIDLTETNGKAWAI